MARKKDSQRGVWIGAIAVVLAAFIGGMFMLLTRSDVPSISNARGPVVIGDNNVTIQELSTQKIRAFVDLLDEVDMHLGDNVYPDAYGVSYNPLTQDIYPQVVQGLVYFDKENKTYLADKSGPTRIGKFLADKLRPQLSEHDYSAYQFVFAVKNDDPDYERLTDRYRGEDGLIDIGGMTLVADGEMPGNFYRRYAAVGFAKNLLIYHYGKC